MNIRKNIPLGEVRCVDEIARVVIPRSLRVKYDIDEGDEISFFDAGDYIGIRKHRSCCCLCGSLENLIYLGKGVKSVCRSCMREIKSA